MFLEKGFHLQVSKSWNRYIWFFENFQLFLFPDFWYLLDLLSILLQLWPLLRLNLLWFYLSLEQFKEHQPVVSLLQVESGLNAGNAVFESNWLIVNLYSLKTTEHKVFKFSVYVVDELRFCHAKCQYWAIDCLKSAQHLMNYHFYSLSVFWRAVLFRSVLYQHLISKQMDLKPWDWSQMIDN